MTILCRAHARTDLKLVDSGLRGLCGASPLSRPAGQAVSAPVGAGQPMGGRVMSTGTCIALIAIGAILRFAVTAKHTHGVMCTS